MSRTAEKQQIKATIKCKSCQEELSLEPAVICAKCQTAYHRRCWDERASCALPSCDSSVFQVPSPKKESPTEEEAPLVLIQPLHLFPKFVRQRTWLQVICIPPMFAAWLIAYATFYLALLAALEELQVGESLKSFIDQNMFIGVMVCIAFSMLSVTSHSGIIFQRRLFFPRQKGYVKCQLAFLGIAIPLVKWTLFHNSEIVDIVSLKLKDQQGNIKEELYLRVGDNRLVELFVEIKSNIDENLGKIEDTLALALGTTVTVSDDPQVIDREDYAKPPSPQDPKDNSCEKSGRCPVCGKQCVDSLAYCFSCKTTHHETCFRYNGGCAIYGCSSVAYTLDKPAEKEEVLSFDEATEVAAEVTPLESFEINGPMPSRARVLVMLAVMFLGTLVLISVPKLYDKESAWYIVFLANLYPFFAIFGFLYIGIYACRFIDCKFSFDKDKDVITRTVVIGSINIDWLLRPIKIADIESVTIRRANAVSGEKIEFFELIMRNKSVIMVQASVLHPNQLVGPELEKLAAKVARYANTSVQLRQWREDAQPKEST